MNKCRQCGREGRFYKELPEGYVARAEAAEKLLKTHHQEQCPDCGRWTIWKRNK